MGDESTFTITPAQIDVLNAARRTLKEISDQWAETADEGHVRAVADVAENAIFHVLNCANAHGVVAVSNDVMIGMEPAVALEPAAALEPATIGPASGNVTRSHWTALVCFAAITPTGADAIATRARALKLDILEAVAGVPFVYDDSVRVVHVAPDAA